MTRIDGNTRLIGLMATPIRHSLSPQMQNLALEKLGLNYVYMAFEVGNDTLKEAIESIRTLDMLGSNVSMPNKKEVIKYLDDLSPAAKLSGAVNTIVNKNNKLIGHITDGTGFMQSLKSEGINAVGKKVVIIGAGGAGTAIAIQAALDGVKEIDIFNINDNYYENALRNAEIINEETKCTANAYNLENESILKEKMAKADIFINATGVGMKPLENESVIKDSSFLHSNLVVCDVVYYPKETILLKMAKEKGCTTINGLGMMLYQGAYAFNLWTNEEMPVEYIKEIMFKYN